MVIRESREETVTGSPGFTGSERASEMKTESSTKCQCLNRMLQSHELILTKRSFGFTIC